MNTGFCLLISVFFSIMCGRFIQISDPERIKVSIVNLEVDDAVSKKFKPRYNIAPTQDIHTVLNTPVPRLTFTHWGLVPFWAKEKSIGNRMINARAETLLAKPSFREPFRRRRCIIFADGFYEWKGTGRSKTPYFLRMKKERPFGLAGLWDHWTDKQTGDTLLSSTIITTDANSLVSQIHNRMPVILDPDHFKVWLSPDPAPDQTLMDCLKPYPDQEMEAYEISRLVNNPWNDSSDCIRPV
jgi:putative SOS response-associated peptidase YedK